MIASNPAWKSPHIENLTGTRAAFKTYSTTGEQCLVFSLPDGASLLAQCRSLRDRPRSTVAEMR